MVNRIKDIKIELLKIFLTDYHQKRDIERLVGQIKGTDYPLEDAIAIVYTNIMKDSDKFEKDKGCGSIYMDSI